MPDAKLHYPTKKSNIGCASKSFGLKMQGRGMTNLICFLKAVLPPIDNDIAVGNAKITRGSRSRRRDQYRDRDGLFLHAVQYQPKNKDGWLSFLSINSWCLFHSPSLIAPKQTAMAVVGFQQEVKHKHSSHPFYNLSNNEDTAIKFCVSLN